MNLGEARAGSRSLTLKRRALKLVLASAPTPVTFSVEQSLSEIQRWEHQWLAVHRECERAWNRTHTCPVHGEPIVHGQQRQREATEKLLRRLQEAAARTPLEPEHLFNQRF